MTPRVQWRKDLYPSVWDLEDPPIKQLPSVTYPYHEKVCSLEKNQFLRMGIFLPSILQEYCMLYFQVVGHFPYFFWQEDVEQHLLNEEWRRFCQNDLDTAYFFPNEEHAFPNHPGPLAPHLLLKKSFLFLGLNEKGIPFFLYARSYRELFMESNSKKKTQFISTSMTRSLSLNSISLVLII